MKLKPYKCDYCPSTFAEKSDLKRHIKRKHPKEYQCPFCVKTFKESNLLEAHIQNTHKFEQFKYSKTVSEYDQYKGLL